MLVYASFDERKTERLRIFVSFFRKILFLNDDGTSSPLPFYPLSSKNRDEQQQIVDSLIISLYCVKDTNKGYV